MSNLPTQAYIDEIDREIDDLEGQIKRLNERRSEAMLAAWNIQVGDLIRYTGRRRQAWTIGRVTRVRPPYRLRVEGETHEDRPWVSVNPQKKDGSFGTAERHAFGEWEKISVAQAA